MTRKEFIKIAVDSPAVREYGFIENGVQIGWVGATGPRTIFPSMASAATAIAAATVKPAEQASDEPTMNQAY